MLELLAIIASDPLSWPLWLVVTLAGGMYPVGFMFGACSDCCCPACNKCNAHYLEFSCLGVESLTVDFDGYGSLVADSSNINENWGADCLFDVPLSLSLGTLAGGDCFYEDGAVSATLGFDTVVDADACGCLHQKLEAGVVIEFGFGGEPPRLGASLTLESQELPELTCDGSTVVLTVSDWYTLEGPSSGACYDQIKSFADSLSLTVTLVNADCECGSCCREESCEEGNTQKYCEEPTYAPWSDDIPAGTWQGVGTDCDPNPCT